MPFRIELTKACSCKHWYCHLQSQAQLVIQIRIYMREYMKALLQILFVIFAVMPLYAQWTEVPINMQGVWGCAINPVDYDNDNDLDIFLMGSTDPGGLQFARIYRNNGNNSFSVVNPGFQGTYRGRSEWADFNGDGYLDVVIVGKINESIPPSSRMYLGSANGTFTDSNVAMLGLDYSWADAGDYDNDGDADLLITGIRNGTNYIKLYRNDGAMVFGEVYAGLLDVSNGQCHWVDVDNDGDLDITVLGSGHCLVYRNEATDQFTRLDYDFTPMSYSASAWGDFNNDGFMDLITTGDTAQGSTTCLYQNMGDGSFTQVTHNIPGRISGSLMWGDYDNDGMQDLFITGGEYPYGPRVSSLYKNMGNRVFQLQVTPFTPISSSDSAFGDMNGDGKLDILMAGYTGSSYLAKYYQNHTPVANNRPTSPNVIWDQVNSVLRFSAATDDSTPASALSYNLKIGTTPGGDEVFPVCESRFGFRREPVHLRKVYYFEPDPFVVYYASAQAIDHSFAGSTFGEILQFQLSALPIITLIGEDTIDFGVVELGSISQMQYCTVKNTGNYSLRINGISFSNQDFSSVDPGFPHILIPGDSLSIPIVFEPSASGEVSATARIFSNASNAGELTINLHATGSFAGAPAQVMNLQTMVSGSDVVLSWDPVTTNENGYPIVVEDYILLFSEYLDNYWYLGHSEGCSFTHQDITLVADHLFYCVKAYNDLPDGAIARLEAQKAAGIRISWDHLKEILEEECARH